MKKISTSNLNPNLIVFDWDGTLADSITTIINCKQFLARKYHLPPPTAEIVKEVLGQDFNIALAKCFPTANQTHLEQLAKEFKTLMQQENWQAPLFADASEILRKLKLNNFKLAVATSKSRLELNSALAFNKLADIFDITCCGEEYCHKPHPAMLEHIRSQFSLLPNQCIMIGDTITDINFAKNANIETIAVSFGAHTAEYLQTASPLAIIDKWTQLPELIDVLCTSNPVSYQ